LGTRRARDGEELFQSTDVGTEVDVISRAIKDEGGHGFDACEFRLSDARFVISKVDNFDIVAVAIQRGDDVMFGGDADGASGVIEEGFGFHMFCLVSVLFCVP
jgi:hypothetical protein